VKNKPLFPLFFVLLITLLVSGVFLSKKDFSKKNLIPKTELTFEKLEKDTLDSLAFVEDSVLVELPPLEQLQIALQELNTDTTLAHGTFGFYLLDVESGEVIAKINEEQSLIPASVMKIVNTGVAMIKMGKNYRFKTRLQYDGELDTINHVLHGNIYIKGGGDPTLGSPVFKTHPKFVVRQWAKAIEKLGIDSIQGGIIADARHFEFNMTPSAWAWGDMQNGYGVGVSGLSFVENTAKIIIKRWGDDRLSIYVIPKIPYLKIKNVMSKNLKSMKNHSYILGSPYGNEYFLKGGIRSDTKEFEDNIPIPDPALLAAYMLHDFLKNKDSLFVRDSLSTIRKILLDSSYTEKERTTFHTIYSPPLKTLIEHTNLTSQNFYAETILKELAVHAKSFGSTENGVKAVKNFLRRKNIDLKGFYMTDGSGLSRFDGLTPKQLGEILLVFAKDSVHFDDFYNTLAVAGETGTLKSIGKNTILEGNLRAKSGTMSRIKSYAGYVKNKSEKELIFVMISNNHLISGRQMKARFEKLMLLIANLESEN
jgi:D-alanyl-D-alanine carboxypeptidase/D-alanyl-D-alanine-endopeptidase (penicillin-binding protein 4)